MAKKLTLEGKILKLELMASQIETDELSINEVLAIHKESVALINECKQEIMEIENTIINGK